MVTLRSGRRPRRVVLRPTRLTVSCEGGGSCCVRLYQEEEYLLLGLRVYRFPDADAARDCYLNILATVAQVACGDRQTGDLNDISPAQEGGVLLPREEWEQHGIEVPYL